MGRGRRPNMALEPTRALQTQRAFRQRKADHLANLEESVKTLSEENAKLRRLLHLEPASPTGIAGGSDKRSSSPSTSSKGTTTSGYVSIAPAGGAPTPSSSSNSPATSTCENCAPIQQANRQLALAASQVEAQMAELHQSIRALRSVLMHHGIPIPSPVSGLAALVDEAAVHRSKRPRHEPALHPEQAPVGVQMTPHYFGSTNAGPSIAGLHEQHIASRRPPPVAGAWHTPSPSAALSAPSPPTNAYSPRHSSYHSPAAGPSYIAPPSTEEAYHRRPPARQNSGNSSGSARPILPAPSMSPARQSAYPPPWQSATVSNPNTPGGVARLHALPATYRSSSYGSASTDVDAYARPPANRRPDEYGHGGYAAGGVSSSYAHPSQYSSSASPYGSGSVHSPRVRAGQSPRDSVHNGEEAYGRSVERVGSATRSSSQASADRSRNTQACGPAKKCCPPREASNAVDSKAAARSTSLVINGHKPDPTGATGNGERHHTTGEPKEDDCCYGFVECDAEVDKPAPAAAPQVLATAKEVDLDGLKLKEDECCFGLVKCDTEGRIIM